MKNGKGAYFPMFVSLEGKEGLVIGGGKTALGKVRHLMPFGPVLKIVAREFCPEILGLCEGMELIRRDFVPEDIQDDLAFVIAASDDDGANRLAASICRRKRIPVNVVDVPKECTFFFPSLVERGRLTVGISTGGASPSAAIHVRKEIESLLDDRLGNILDYLAMRRGPLKEMLTEESHRKEVFSRLFERCLEMGRPLTEEEEGELIR